MLCEHSGEYCAQSFNVVSVYGRTLGIIHFLWDFPARLSSGFGILSQLGSS